MSPANNCAPTVQPVEARGNTKANDIRRVPQLVAAKQAGGKTTAVRPMTQCPRYEACSAPLCPLDPGRELRVHDSEDPLCFLLLESVKVGAADRFLRLHVADIGTAATATLSAPETPTLIKAAAARAATTGSRIERGRRLSHGVSDGEVRR